jgi:hypothetical protein
VVNADGRAESALESLGRLTCIDGGLPVPLSNVWVGPGYPLYRLDHLWAYHWLAAEGDGALKYRGRDPAGALFPRLAVGELADQVQVPVVSRGLLDHVHEHPPQRRVPAVPRRRRRQVA